jgi:hypothetical protein
MGRLSQEDALPELIFLISITLLWFVSGLVTKFKKKKINEKN